MVLDEGDVDRWAAGQREDDEKENHACREMRGVVPSGANVHELCKSGENHDESGNGAAQGCGRPGHSGRRGLQVRRCIDLGRVEGSVKPVE